MAKFHHLLVPIDGSATSLQALDEAVRLAASSGARITLLHVIDELRYVTGFESAMSYLNEIVPLMRDAGEKLLADAGQKALTQGLPVDCVLIDPSMEHAPARLWERVNDQAQISHADLIVLGSHGRRGVGRALMGSDAEQIVRHAELPVLVVRAPQAAANVTS